jgi:hypothetical protein
MKPRTLARELDRAIANVDDRARRRLHALGIPEELTQPPLAMVGIDRVRQTAQHRYEPADAGATAFVTPIFIGNPASPEALDPVQTARRDGDLVDLIGWHPNGGWGLRAGIAAWLGAIPPQYLDPPPVRVHRHPLGWLRGGLRGLVIVADDPVEAYVVLADCRGGIVADDERHRVQLQRILNRQWAIPPITSIAERRRAA